MVGFLGAGKGAFQRVIAGHQHVVHEEMGASELCDLALFAENIAFSETLLAFARLASSGIRNSDKLRDLGGPGAVMARH